MTTPPRVTDEQVSAAIARIARRHRGTDNPGQHLLGGDPREALVYLRRCGPSLLMSDQESHDVEDGLVVRLGLWWEGELAEHRLLEAAERLGLNRRRVGAVLGITTGQGLLDRRDRKEALLGPAGVPSEKVARADRRGRGEVEPAAPVVAPDAGPLRRWIARLIELRDLLPDDLAEDVTLLRRETTPRAEMGFRELCNAARMILADLQELDHPDAELGAIVVDGAQLLAVAVQ